MALWQNPVVYSYLLLAILSLCIGSLLNVIIFRLPMMIENEWKQECRLLLNIKKGTASQPINLFFPRSFCPSCKHTVRAIHNIPLLSYLFLSGKCAYCKHPISWRYPLVELLTLALSMLTVFHFGLSLTMLLALVFVWVLIALFFIDLDHQLLPDSLTLGLLWLGLLANTQNAFTTLPNAVFSAAIAYSSLWVIMQLFKLATGKTGMGHGDFKLFAAFGAWFGWIQVPFILLFASLSGAISGIVYLKLQSKGADTPIPFGPFLCLAAFVALLYGPWIINWYLGLWY